MNYKFAHQLTLLTGTAIFCFVAGMAVAHYKLFPFNQLMHLKKLIVGETAGENAFIARETERYQVYYLDKKTFFEQQTTQADIVMVGDSIVDGAEWKELLPEFSIANRGIAGDNIEGILNRLDSIDSVDASKAFIMAGYNDLRKDQTVEAVFENYKAVIEHLLAHGTKTYIQSTLLVGNGLTEWNDKIRQLNALLEIYARKKGLVFIDLNAFFAKDGELSPAFSRDGIHLNGDAYSLWAEELRPHLR